MSHAITSSDIVPAYSFQSLTSQGEVRKGVLQAETARLARSQLRAQDLVPISVDLVSVSDPASADESRRRRVFRSKQVFPSAELSLWTRQLSGLVTAGLPIERALYAMTDDSPLESQRNLIALLRSEVNAGSTLANALALYPREFPAVFVAAVAAGEQGGSLATVLERLADDLESQQVLRSKLFGAVLYPAIVSVIALLIVGFLLAYVVPQVASVFAGTKRSLPWLTVVMLSLGNAVRGWGWLLLLLAATAFGAGRMARRHPQVRESLDALWLRLPVVGGLIQGFDAARFSRTLAVLAAAGVPVLKALQAAAATLGNAAMRRDAQKMVGLVREGAPLSTAIQQHTMFPSLLVTFTGLGERTGQLPQMLDRVAKQLGDRVLRRAMHLATIAEPLLIVGMGLVVALIVLAVLLPIMELNQLVK